MYILFFYKTASLPRYIFNIFLNIYYMYV
jgi:hypothetical protein